MTTPPRDQALVEELRDVARQLRAAARPVPGFDPHADRCDRAAARIEAVSKHAADLELMVRASASGSEHAAPLWVEDEPGRGKGWAVYFHDERYLFIPAGADGLPIIDDETRSLLDAKDETR